MNYPLYRESGTGRAYYVDEWNRRIYVQAARQAEDTELGFTAVNPVLGFNDGGGGFDNGSGFDLFGSPVGQPYFPPNNFVPQTFGQSYTVQSGDTLSKIAARFGTTVAAIAQANGIGNVNQIYVGQQLTIPGAGGGAAVDLFGNPLRPQVTPTQTQAQDQNNPPKPQAKSLSDYFKSMSKNEKYVIEGGVVLLLAVLLMPKKKH